MEIDLEAIIAAANRVQQSCDYHLGNCSRVLHIGFFFDGVGRNIEQYAPENRLSNIALLFRAFPEYEDKTSKTAYKKHYISGLGTMFNESVVEKLQATMDGAQQFLLDELKNKPGDMVKEAFQESVGGASGKEVLMEMKNQLLSPKGRLGLLKDSAVNALKRVSIEATPWLRDSEFMAYNLVTGVNTRLNSLKKRFTQSCEEAVSEGEVPVRLISLSVFGFDMGATLARQFIDIFLDDVCEKGSDGRYSYQSVPVDIVFIGLFDCSRDTPESSNNGLDYAASAVSWLPGPLAKTAGTTGSLFGRKYIEHMSPLPDAVKRSLHLVAAHERRAWRCVYRTGKSGPDHQEQLMPGCSEDIGGGLKPDEQKPSAELCRVSLCRMYREAMMAGVPFPDFNSLDKYNPVIAAYFTMKDTVKKLSAGQWVARYQKSVPDKQLSYQSMNRHLDSYFEWLGRQHYEYKRELHRLEGIKSGILNSSGASAGFVGITPQASKAADDVTDDIRTLKKHWGWLSEVANEAHLLISQKFHYPPQMFMENIHLPACERAKHFVACGTAGYNGEPLPMQSYSAPPELYAWFLHDVQRPKGIDQEYFYIRWMEPWA